MYGKEKKTVSRSIRMTETVSDYVNSFGGNGFNEKFEGLVLTMFRDEKLILDRIEKRKAELESLNAEIQERRNLANRLSLINSKISDLLKVL